MAEKKKRLIDDLLQDDFFGIKEEKVTQTEKEAEEEEVTLDSSQLFEEELIEEKESEEETSEEIAEEPEEIKTTTGTEKQEKKKSGTLIAILILLLIVAGAGSAYFFLAGRKATKKIAKITTPKQINKGKVKIIKKKIVATNPATSTTAKEATEKNLKVAKANTPRKTNTLQNQQELPKQTTAKGEAKNKKQEFPKTASVTPKQPKPAPPPKIEIPKYSIKIGPFSDETNARKWLLYLSKMGEVNLQITTKTTTSFYIDAGLMDNGKATALKMKVDIFLPDQKNKMITENQGGKVHILFGPYTQATQANSVLARLKHPRVGVLGKVVTQVTPVKVFYLRFGKFATREEALQSLSKIQKLGLKAEVAGL